MTATTGKLFAMREVYLVASAFGFGACEGFPIGKETPRCLRRGRPISPARPIPQNHPRGAGRTMQPIEQTFESRLHSAISSNPYLAGRHVRFEAEEGRVVLRGVVNTYFQKQMAQESLRRVEGVREIENELTVMWT
jgi:hypothetical protein